VLMNSVVVLSWIRKSRYSVIIHFKMCLATFWSYVKGSLPWLISMKPFVVASVFSTGSPRFVILLPL